MEKQIIIHDNQSSIFDIIDDTTTQIQKDKKEQAISLKLSELLALKNNVKLKSELINALERDELEIAFKILSNIYKRTKR